jgi:HAD superfamily hydrolase (TIGR01490 family)
MERRLVIFDFDGTLTYKDSMIEFVRYYRGNLRFILGMIWLFPKLLLYKLNLIPNNKAKELFLTYFFKNEPVTIFREKGDRFAQEIIPSLLIPSALRQFEEHLRMGDQLVVISASAESWLRQWCDHKKVSLLATRLQVINNVITGKLSGPNCYGIEKVNRLKAFLDLEKFKEIIVYGDSKGDNALFEISTNHYYKYFQ